MQVVKARKQKVRPRFVALKQAKKYIMDHSEEYSATLFNDFELDEQPFIAIPRRKILHFLREIVDPEKYGRVFNSRKEGEAELPPARRYVRDVIVNVLKPIVELPCFVNLLLSPENEDGDAALRKAETALREGSPQVRRTITCQLGKETRQNETVVLEEELDVVHLQLGYVQLLHYWISSRNIYSCSPKRNHPHRLTKLEPQGEFLRFNPPAHLKDDEEIMHLVKIDGYLEAFGRGCASDEQILAVLDEIFALNEITTMYRDAAEDLLKVMDEKCDDAAAREETVQRKESLIRRAIELDHSTEGWWLRISIAMAHHGLFLRDFQAEEGERSAQDSGGQSFIERFADHLEWIVLSNGIGKKMLSEKVVPRFLRLFAGRLNWITVMLNIPLDEELYESIPQREWDLVFGLRGLSEPLLERLIERDVLKSHYHWCHVTRVQVLSEAFMRRHASDVEWSYVARKQFNLSVEFLEEFADRLNWVDVYLYQTKAITENPDFASRNEWRRLKDEKHRDRIAAMLL